MKRSRKFLSTILFIIAIVCIFIAIVMAISLFAENRRSEQLVESLRPTGTQQGTDSSRDPEQTPVPSSTKNDQTSSADTDQTSGSTLDDSSESTPESTEAPTPEPTPAPVPNPYGESFKANEDMAAWLIIPDTNVDYPVMWTPRDEEFYLRKNFNGKKDSNGCLILDTDSCLNPLTTNLIIHGHNMKSGAMFGQLTKYEKEDYYKEHRQIILHTEERQRNYEIIAVFRSQVYLKTDNVFKFYKFFQADTEEEFNVFYKNIKELSLYDTGVTAQFGDNFITLSTCVYHVKNGRFVVVAKEVESGDTYLPVE